LKARNLEGEGCLTLAFSFSMEILSQTVFITIKILSQLFNNRRSKRRQYRFRRSVQSIFLLYRNAKPWTTNGNVVNMLIFKGNAHTPSFFFHRLKLSFPSHYILRENEMTQQSRQSDQDELGSLCPSYIRIIFLKLIRDG
ncbi:hypothetical protein AABB24_000945, partial [Solanum stoloniferum]